MSQVVSIPVGVVLVGVLVAAATDLWKFRVYNVLTLPLIGSGLLYHALVDHGAGFASSVGGLLLGFGVLILFHVLGGMGAGDVKLMAGVGSWLGVELTFYVFIASALAGGLYALGLTFYTGRFKETLLNFRLIFLRLATIGRILGADDELEVESQVDDRRTRLIPFGAMVAVGLLCTVLYLVFRPH